MKSNFKKLLLLPLSSIILGSVKAVSNNEDKKNILNEIDNNYPVTYSINTTKNRYVEGTTIDERPPVKVDYSGKGTVIQRPVDSKACSIQSERCYERNDKLHIPVFYGKYTKRSNASSWSSWSPNNYRVNDYYTYRGEETTEYEVQSKTEYYVSHSVKRDFNKTRYVTWFRGTKWWNCLITYFVYDDLGFRCAPENYKVINTYTKQVYSHSEYFTESEWRDNIPRGWTCSKSRTTHRYKTRTIKWDEKGYKGWEEVPLYYSLYQNDGPVIKKGIMLESDSDISYSYKSPSGDITDNYKTKCFYVPTSVIEKEILDDILHSAYSDEISETAKGFIEGGETALAGLLESLAKYFEQNAMKSIAYSTTYSILSSLCKISALFAAISVCLGITQGLIDDQKKMDFNDMRYILKHLNEYNLLSISYYKYFSMGGSYVSWAPMFNFDAALVDSKTTYSDDVNYISMNFNRNKKADANNSVPYHFINGCDSYYGKIKYMDSLSYLYDSITSYFSFNIFDISTWFNY